MCSQQFSVFVVLRPPLLLACHLQAFSLSTLEVFREDEMELLLCGAGEHWSPQQLADSMKFDHGYTAQSTPVR